MKCPVVVGATQMDRCGKVGEAQLLPARTGDVERLQTPVLVGTVDLLLAGGPTWDANDVAPIRIFVGTKPP
jgi:hypothetical protein